MITHLSLFSGIGGLDLAAEWAGLKTVGQCEWAEYPTKVLEKHWPDVPRWKDIRTLTGRSFYERTGLRTVDVISGGFPCQPFSIAGKQRGREDDRYLWPEMVRVIKELRPAWVIGENVAGIVRMALADILSELEACGYRTRAFLIPACAVGARHRRYRVAIVGYAEHNGPSAAEVGRSIEETGRGQQEGKKPPGKPAGTGRPGNGQNVADAKSKHEGRLSVGKGEKKPGFISGGQNVADAKSKRNGMLPDEREKQGQKNADTDRRCEDVQYADGAGCEEQHTSGEPDKQGFPGRGRNAGDVCDTTGEGLPDRAGKPLGGCEAPQQEFKRPGRNVSDADNRSRAMRRDGELPAVEKAGKERHDHRERTEEHEPGERRTAQPGLGGMADGVPGGMDRDFIINHYWDIEPDIPRIATGIPNRVGRLKALGNAVVPQQFYPIFQAVADIENQRRRIVVNENRTDRR